MTTKIQNLIQDLINKLKTVDVLDGNLGLTLGSTDVDPQMRDIGVPSAWPMFQGDRNTGTTHARALSETTFMFVVYVTIGYGGSDMDTVQYPILEQVSSAIRGRACETEAMIQKWKYEGQVLLQGTEDRLHYAQTYSIAGVQ